MLTLLAQAGRTEVERRFEFASLPEGWWAVFGLAFVAATLSLVLWAYRHEGRRGASLAVRTFLSICRCLVILTLVGIWVQPVLATYIHRWIDSYAIVLIDDSSSMDLQDRYKSQEDRDRVSAVMEQQIDAVRRADVVDRLLSKDENAFIRKLAERNRVKVFRFSDRPELAATVRSGAEDATNQEPQNETPDALADATSVNVSTTAQGSATDISRALRRSIESLGGAPLAGVVLLTDGGFNQGDPVQVVARFIEDRQIPLYAVGVGDPSPPQNIRIVEVSSPDNAFKEDPFTITAHLAARGMDSQTIRVELHETGAGEPETGVPV